MRRQPENIAYALLLGALLSACSPNQDDAPQTPHIIAASVEANQAAIASAILADTAPQSDILQARKEAKAEVSASDIAEMAAQMNMLPEYVPDTFQAASVPENLPPLHPICEQYYQRVDACFARQGDDANALRAQNQEAKIEVMRENPDEATCHALNQSFNSVAMNLGCE
ncbi:hypothetical protein [Wielerella bovis]|uniref:hypothetical protein n=1 Tax=Wielerella bovis TaxID=2917790 RepID=UPI002018DEED|nr:hypothetical protein [Wielerella bovis]ULJ65581.1 hypothetical protein MIS33_04800 [Wielerella bovis]ULJ66375.1 hypothetical protein MIS31_08905 [Wielerella bovis]